MHENSITEQDPKNPNSWRNLSGLTRKPLIPEHPWEMESYPSMKEAVEAARRRSNPNILDILIKLLMRPRQQRPDLP